MDLRSKKLNFIKEVLAIRNDRIIDKLMELLKKEKERSDPKKPTTSDLLGTMTEREADSAKKEITEACENIRNEDWR